MKSHIFVECLDVVEFSCDVLVLKYAQDFYGADLAIAVAFDWLPDHFPNNLPKPGQHILLPTNGKIAAKNILFVGVVDLYKFDYEKIREFTATAMKIVYQELPDTKTIAMTMHGAGYGLDEREAFSAQVGGLIDSFQDNATPQFLESITVLEKNKRRAARIDEILQEFELPIIQTKNSHSLNQTIQSSVIDAGLKTNTKQHIFVAMPYSEDMEDIYIFGIQGPVNTAGYLCERVDMTTFTGDILSRIKSRSQATGWQPIVRYSPNTRSNTRSIFLSRVLTSNARSICSALSSLEMSGSFVTNSRKSKPLSHEFNALRCTQ